MHTFDTKVKIPAAANTGVTANPATGTFACGANATLLTLGLMYAGNVARTGGTPTYGGVTGTQADTNRGVTECSAELWYWLAPPTGQTLLISIPNAGGLLLEGFVSSYAAQNGYASLLDVSGGTGTTAANPFWRLTTKSPGDAIIGVVADGVNAWNPTSQSGTALYNDDPSTWGGGAQYILQSASGTVTIEWQANSDDYGIVTAAFREQDTGNRSNSLTDTVSGADVNPTISVSLSSLDGSSGGDEVYPYQPSVGYRSRSYNGLPETTGSDNLAVAIPTGTVIDDILLAFISYEYTGDVTILPETNIGTTWIEVPSAAVVNTNASPNLHGRLLWRRATQKEIDFAAFPYVFGFSSIVQETNIHIYACSGATTINVPVEIANNISGNGDCTLPSISIGTKYSDIIGYVAGATFARTWSSSNMVERWDQRASALYDLFQINAGASGTKLISQSDTGEFIGIICCVSTNGAISKLLTETGTGTDSLSNLLTSLSINEQSQGTELITTTLAKYIQDIVLDIFTGTMISVSDTGTGTDRATVSALLSLIEQGIGIETISQLASLVVLERAFGIDSFQLANSLGLIDIAISQDNLSLSALLTSFDFGTALDLIRSVASLQVLEQSLSSDNISNLIASLAISDFGFSSDVISILISVLKAVSDSGSGSDQVLNILASLSVNDLSLVTESLINILASLQISETSLGLDNLANLIASLSVSDYASGSEAISVLAAFLISVIDSGSGSDRIANLLASLSVSEISSVLEALVEAVSTSLFDSGAGIDSSALAANLGLTDTTLAGDFLGLFALDVIAELGSGSDTLPSLLASLGINEGGSAGDLLNLLASLSVGDVGSGSDLVNVLAGIVKAISDVASGLDGVSISASMSMVDNGSGVDNLSLSVSLTVRDTGIGTDTLSVLTQTLRSIFDNASGIDRLSISASLNIPEPSFGIDSSAIAASLIGYDISITSDSPQIQASLTLTDASSSTDIVSILQTAIKLVQDLASGNDFIGTISASIPVSDQVIGGDQIAQLLASLLVTDFGTGVEVVISYDITTQIIKISFIIKKSAIGFAFAQPKMEFEIGMEKKKLIEFEFKCPKIEFSLQTEQMMFSFLDGG